MATPFELCPQRLFTLQFAQAGRMRVNMGNIYFEQRKFTQAIKMYRMALDQVPGTQKETRYKIMRNIGVAFMRLGQYQVRDVAPSVRGLQLPVLLCFRHKGLYPNGYIWSCV
jgi:hypothetical protein